MPSSPDTQTAPNRSSSSRMSRLLAPTIALVAVAGLGIASLGGGDPDTAATPSASAPTDTATAPDPTAAPDTAPAEEAEAASFDGATREPNDPLAKGDVDAPVVMVEWADFQCPFCGRFARDTAPELIDRYVDQGLLRIEWRDFPYLGPESTTAAQAARAAAQQDAFWEFHDAIFAEAREPNTGELTRDAMVAIATDLGLDVAAFEAAMDDPAVAEAVQADFDLGQQLGINGTPAFLVNGQPVMGAQPLETFVQLIENAAENA